MHSHLVIPFEEMDARLKAIGRDRKWLSQATGRKLASIRVALAPNTQQKNRSHLLQVSLSQAIEAEKARQKDSQSAIQTQVVSLQVDREQFRAWNAAAMAEGKLIEEWAILHLARLAAGTQSPPIKK